jgi:hypothetical protein
MYCQPLKAALFAAIGIAAMSMPASATLVSITESGTHTPAAATVQYTERQERNTESPLRPERNSESPLRPEQNSESPLRPERNSESPLRPERNDESPLRADRNGGYSR